MFEGKSDWKEGGVFFLQAPTCTHLLNHLAGTLHACTYLTKHLALKTTQTEIWSVCVFWDLDWKTNKQNYVLEAHARTFSSIGTPQVSHPSQTPYFNVGHDVSEVVPYVARVVVESVAHTTGAEAHGLGVSALLRVFLEHGGEVLSGRAPLALAFLYPGLWRCMCM